MALSITKLHSWVNTGKGNTTEGIVNIDLNDTNYAEGGWSVTADDLSSGASTVYAFNIVPAYSPDGAATTAGVFSYNFATSKIQAWVSAADGDALDEVAAGNVGLDAFGDAVLRVHYIVY
jgi:hypothetical protein